MSPEINFVGFDNFIKAFTSPAVQAAFFVTYKFFDCFCSYGVNYFDDCRGISERLAEI